MAKVQNRKKERKEIELFLKRGIVRNSSIAKRPGKGRGEKRKRKRETRERERIGRIGRTKIRKQKPQKIKRSEV